MERSGIWLFLGDAGGEFDMELRVRDEGGAPRGYFEIVQWLVRRVCTLSFVGMWLDAVRTFRAFMLFHLYAWMGPVFC